MSSSKLLKKGYYLYYSNKIVKLCIINTEIALASVLDRLFTLKKLKKLYNTSLISFSKIAINYVIILI